MPIEQADRQHRKSEGGANQRNSANHCFTVPLLCNWLTIEKLVTFGAAAIQSSLGSGKTLYFVENSEIVFLVLTGSVHVHKA